MVPLIEPIPVKEGRGGRDATVGEVRKVKYGEDEKVFPKTSIPAETVVRRVVKQRVEVAGGKEVLENEVKFNREPSMQDLQLAEIFNSGLTDSNSLS